MSSKNHKYDDDDDDEDEVDFETYVRRQTNHFYVGGFCPTMTEKKLTNYFQRRGIPHGSVFEDMRDRIGL